MEHGQNVLLQWTWKEEGWETETEENGENEQNQIYNPDVKVGVKIKTDIYLMRTSITCIGTKRILK